MGSRVNSSQLGRFNRCVGEHYQAMLAEIAASDPPDAVPHTGAGFASVLPWTSSKTAATEHSTDHDAWPSGVHQLLGTAGAMT
jgi:hypothetical protein